MINMIEWVIAWGFKVVLYNISVIWWQVWSIKKTRLTEDQAIKGNFQTLLAGSGVRIISSGDKPIWSINNTTQLKSAAHVQVYASWSHMTADNSYILTFPLTHTTHYRGGVPLPFSACTILLLTCPTESFSHLIIINDVLGYTSQLEWSMAYNIKWTNTWPKC